MWTLAQLQKIEPGTCQKLLQNAHVSQSLVRVPEWLGPMRQLDFPKITFRCHGDLAKRRLSAFTSFSLPLWVNKGGSATLCLLTGCACKRVRKVAERFG
jgi:hypothetical protein